MQPKICLGTAQFGMNYGITNQKGQISKIEIQEILDYACNQEITYLDTAQSYGNSEDNIGLSLKNGNKFKIMSKLSPNEKNYWDINSITKLNIEFNQSLEKLKVKNLDTLFIHRVSDLRLKGNLLLLDWLKKLKKNGLIKRIGLSIYLSSDLNGLPLEIIDLIQLPVSIYDQRMVNSGLIKKLSNRGISIFGRSIFLQGLILSKLNWPNFISNDMYKHHLNLVNFVEKHNITLLDAALAFIQNIEGIEAFVVGISCKNDLTQIINSYKNTQSFNRKVIEDINSFFWDRENDLDPRSWK